MFPGGQKAKHKMCLIDMIKLNPIYLAGDLGAGSGVAGGLGACGGVAVTGGFFKLSNNCPRPAAIPVPAINIITTKQSFFI